MRARSLVAAVAAAPLLAVPALPASGGTGYSTTCDDGDVVLTRPATVAVKTLTSGENTKVWVCYSTTPSGTSGLGGAIHLDIWRNPTGTHGLYVGVACYPDGVGDFCEYANRVGVAPSDLGDPLVSLPPGTCAVYNGTTCTVRLPAGVVVTLNDDPARPLVWVQVLNRPVTVEAPVRCLSLLAPC